MSGSVSRAMVMEEDEESDWEYEYSQTETETFYVTLDLSSASQHYRNPRKDGGDVPNSRIVQTAQAAPPDSTNGNGHENTRSDDEGVQEDPTSEQVAKPTVETLQQSVQILDFHGLNPIVSYGGQTYSCKWATTLGTDVLLSIPDQKLTPEPEDNEPEDGDQDVIDPELMASFEPSSPSPLLTTTRIKLVGRPVSIKARNEGDATIGQANSKSPATAISASNISSSTTHATPSPRIPLGSAPSRARQRQAAFLEKIMAIKERKGETDKVTVHAAKPQLANKAKESPAATSTSARRVEFDVGNLQEETAPAPERSTEAGRPRGRGRGGRRRGRAYRQRLPMSGLFRDQMTQYYQIAHTPNRWRDLEDPNGQSSDGLQDISNEANLAMEEPSRNGATGIDDEDTPRESEMVDDGDVVMGDVS